MSPFSVEVAMERRQAHWDGVYAAKADRELGWYEGDVGQTRRFLDRIADSGPRRVFLTGAGTSLLVDDFLRRGDSVVLNDVSPVALGRLRERLGAGGEAAEWVCQDIADPLPVTLQPVDLWVDRAVLHFLLDEAAIAGYFENLRRLLRPGGHVLFAEFSETGAVRCAGLDVHRYSLGELSDRLGDRFGLVMAEDHIFINPTGAERPYVYALFRRAGA